MSTRTKRFILPESEIPTQWYNIAADMPNKPMPPLNPQTREPLRASDLYPIFAKALADQETLRRRAEHSQQRWPIRR